MAAAGRTRARRSEGSRARRKQPRFRVLVIDDSEMIRTYLASFLELKGYDVDTAEDGRRALALLEGGAAPDVIVLDVMLPGLDGLETLRRIRDLDAETPVVMLSVVGKASTIVEAMTLGASDYLNKPFDEDEFIRVLEKVLEKKAHERDLEAEANSPYRESVVWQSPAMIRVREMLDQVSDTDVTILIQGESGVGKEVVARRAHEVSNRAKNTFVKVNCAALPEDLLESELFGYEKGAFTGAAHRKQGKFELANRGTIFLDEIGEMSAALQGKLLQVLQDGEFTRLGGNADVRVDVRVICATNRHLEGMVREGTFREDLFFRLNVVAVAIPPLRERREEIGPLIDTFLRRYPARYQKPIPQLSSRLVSALERYSFPGTVRELENMIKRVVVLESEQPIFDDLRREERSGERPGSALNDLIEQIEAQAGEMPLREVGRLVALEVERETIERVLEHTNWNRKQASRILGVSYKTLLQKIRGCGLEPD
jgi:two-component system response regulator AtoC